MYKHIAIICLLVVQFSFIHTQTTVATNCTLKGSSDREKKLLEQLNNLQIPKQFSIKDDEHLYSIGICTKAADAKEANIGIIQTNIKTNNTYVIGRLDDVDIDGSEMYLRVVYKNGDKYNRACGGAERTAVIAIVCNYVDDKEVFSLLEENNNRANDSCAYYFQLMTPKACVSERKNCDSKSSTTPQTTTTTTSATTTTTAAATTNSASTTAAPNPSTASTQTSSQSTKSSPAPNTTAINANQTTTSAKSQTGSRLGFFSISAIVLTSVLFCYFVIGTLYNRFVNQTRGIEQLPHWQFWHSLGIKFQECSYLICKCRKKQSDIRAYDHINDQLSDDENLLNM